MQYMSTRGYVHRIVMLLYLVDCNIIMFNIAMRGLFFSNYDRHICLSHCDIYLCLSHCVVTMFGRLQCYYVWHIATYVFQIVTSQCNTCQHGDMFITLRRWEMFVTLRRQKNVCHIATVLCLVDYNITMFETLRRMFVRFWFWGYVHQIVIVTFGRLQCYYVRHIEMVGNVCHITIHRDMCITLQCEDIQFCYVWLYQCFRVW